MKVFEIKGSVRKTVGKKDTKRLRNTGIVPCVLYGGEKVIHFQALEKEFRKIIYTSRVYLLKIDIDGTVYNGIMQDIQFHPVTEKILHIDFLHISEDKPIKIDIPVRLDGYAEGIRQGGELNYNLRKLTVRALAKDLPDEIVLDVSGLALGDSIRVADVSVKGLEVLNTPTVPIASVTITRAARAAQSEEEEAATMEEAVVEDGDSEESTEEK